MVVSTHNSVLSTRIKRLCGFQPSRVVLCMQINDFSTWITSLYWSQPSCVVFGCKTATFGLELQGSVGQRPHPLFCMQNFDFWTRITSLYGSQTWPVILCMYNSVLNIRITSLYGSQPSSVVFAFKTAWLASELLVSMGPRPHDWFLDAKQRLSDRNKKSLWVPNITFCFVHA